jgi:molybdopterin synthase catalytic subunit
MRGAEITRAEIQPAAVLGRVGGERDGAAVLFLGMVRNSNDGRAVTGMRYAAYEAMAEAVLLAIVEEAAARWGLERAHAVHRIGELGVGEVSVAIAVSSPHRGEAYEASRYIIEQVKLRLPVWKQERYGAADARWLAGETVEQGG